MGSFADKAAGSWSPWLAAIGALVVAILVINPVGFIGGGMDDWQYLNAARCWVEQGPCLPRDHWQGRWPVVGPLALVIELFGESRWTIGLPSLLASLGCLALCAWVGNRLFGRPVGYLAALLLLLTPAFAASLLTPSVEPTELLLLLAGLSATLKAKDTGLSGWAFIAGLAFGLAFQVRETAVAALPLAAVLVFRTNAPGRRLPAFAAAAAGFFAPLIVEMISFGIMTGDPLWRRGLSVAHTQIASTELLGPIDRSGLPFFNTDLIANWRHEPGLRLHWTVDGLLNLMVNPKAGVTQWLAPLLLLVLGKAIDRERRQTCWAILAAAVAYGLILVYALALDPNPRIMIAPLCLIGLVLAALIPPLWAGGRKLFAIVAIAVPLVTTLFIVAIHHQVRDAEQAAAAWLDQIGEQAAADETTRRHLALVPEADKLASIDGTAERRYLLLKVRSSCQRWLRSNRSYRKQFAIVGEAHFGLSARFGDDGFGSLCLFRAKTPLSGRHLRLAIAETNMKKSR